MPWLNRNSAQEDLREPVEDFELEETDYLSDIFAVLEDIRDINRESRELFSGIHEELVRLNRTIESAMRQARQT